MYTVYVVIGHGDDLIGDPIPVMALDTQMEAELVARTTANYGQTGMFDLLNAYRRRMLTSDPQAAPQSSTSPPPSAFDAHYL